MLHGDGGDRKMCLLSTSRYSDVLYCVSPQVLNLPSQSLQQEIELTEDLMELFVQHQIPSDLLMATPDDTTGTAAAVVAAAPVDPP